MTCQWKKCKAKAGYSVRVMMGNQPPHKTCVQHLTTTIKQVIAEALWPNATAVVETVWPELEPLR